MSIQICTNVYVPLRTGPSHKAEMGSQILMGEKYEIIDRAGCYIKIRLLFDGYTGWLDNDHICSEEYKSSAVEQILAQDILASLEDGNQIRLLAGSEISEPENDFKGFKVGSLRFITENPVSVAPLDGDLTLTALRYLNAPYLWGGRTSMGLDCSGLVQTVYKVHGISIPKDSFNQAEHGTTVNMLSDSKPGDLLFFDNARGTITHVGMLLNNGEIIHSSGKVRIDLIDHQGIYRRSDKKYTHKLRLIKRFN